MVKPHRLTAFLLRLSARQNRRDWAQSFAVIAIGAIAITLFSGFLANASSLQNRIDNMVAQSNVADVYVTTDPRSGYDLKEGEKLANAIPEIKGIESRFYSYCSLASRNALAMIEPAMPQMSRPYELLKTSPEQTDTHYFIVDNFLTESSSAQAAQNDDLLKIGGPAHVSLPLSGFSLDRQMITFLDAFLKPGKKNPLRQESLDLTFTVTGAMKHFESAARGTFNPTNFLVSSSYFRDVLRDTLSESFTPTGIRLIWKQGFQKTLGWGDGDPEGNTANFPLANQYLLRIENHDSAKLIKQKVQDYYAKKPVDNLYYAQTWDETTSLATLKIETDQAWQLTFVFPVVFFAVALLVNLISVRQMILHERMEIGTFKALGVTKGEIHRHYAIKTLNLVGLGTLLGEIIGPFLVPAILGNKYSILYTLPPKTYVFPWGPCLAAAAVFIGVSLLVTYLVSRREIKLKPVESMRPTAPEKKEKKVLRSKDSGFVQISLKMAGRGIRGDIVKTAMVIIGVLGCTALLCCGYGIEDTINYGVDTDPLIVSGADVTLFTIEAVDETNLKTQLNLVDENGQPLVNGYQPFSRKPLNIVSETKTYYTNLQVISDYVLQGGTAVKEHFKYVFPIDQVVMSEKVARALEVGVGDVISFYIDDLEVEAKVYQTLPIFYDNGVFIHAGSPLLAGKVKAFNAAWVDAISPEKAGQVEALARKIPNVAICDSEASWRERVKEAMSSVLVMTNAIKVFAFLLAFVVLYDLGLLNFKEHQREIATMKVLGFKEMEIMFSLLVETLSMCLVGILGGLAIGYPFTKLVLYINQVELVDFLYTVYPVSYAIAFGFTFFLSVAINLLLTLRIRKIMAVESLKSIE